MKFKVSSDENILDLTKILQITGLYLDFLAGC